MPVTPSAAKPHIIAKTSVEDLASELGLKLGDQNGLTIRRVKRGKGYSFHRANGTQIRHAGTIRRLHSMAVPPAYRDVRYSADPSSHLQAVGIDAAGRLQYRYHVDWEKVREQRKAHRLARLVAALPKIRRKVSAYLSGDEPGARDVALPGSSRCSSRDRVSSISAREASGRAFGRPAKGVRTGGPPPRRARCVRSRSSGQASGTRRTGTPSGPSSGAWRPVSSWGCWRSAARPGWHSPTRAGRRPRRAPPSCGPASACARGRLRRSGASSAATSRWPMIRS